MSKPIHPNHSELQYAEFVATMNGVDYWRDKVHDNLGRWWWFVCGDSFADDVWPVFVCGGRGCFSANAEKCFLRFPHIKQNLLLLSKFFD